MTKQDRITECLLSRERQETINNVLDEIITTKGLGCYGFSDFSFHLDFKDGDSPAAVSITIMRTIRKRGSVSKCNLGNC